MEGLVLRTPSRPGLVGLLEIDPTGHRLRYLRYLVDAAGPDGSMVLTSEHAAGSEEYATHMAGVCTPPHVLTGVRTRIEVLAGAVEQATASGVGILAVPDGDLYLLPLLRLMLRRPRLPLRVNLLLMRTTEVGGPEPLRPATAAKPILVQLLRPFRQVRIHFLTDALGVVDRRRGYPGVCGLRDPVMRSQRAEEEGRRPRWFPPAVPDSVLVGVFGVISSRKNLPLLLDALRTAPAMVVVVGGRLEPDVRKLVESEAVRNLITEGRLVVRDQMLGEDEFGAALAASDVAAVLHDNDAPSGILAEACIRNVPVLVPSGGWLARIVATTGIGMATALEGGAIADAVRAISRDPSSFVEATRVHEPKIDTGHFTRGLLGR